MRILRSCCENQLRVMGANLAKFRRGCCTPQKLAALFGAPLLSPVEAARSWAC